MNSLKSDFSIIIVNYRSWEKLDKCLNSIFKQKLLPFSTIVVDNFSNDGKIIIFKKKFKSVNWIENKENVGFSKACNLGYKLVKTKWILFLNPDTYFPEECFSTLLPYCNSNESFHLVAIKQLNKSLKNSYPFGIFPNTLNLFPFIRIIERNTIKYKQSKYNLSKVKIGYPDWISGSFILIRKFHFDLLNKWDEDYWMYCEDIELSKKASMNNLNRVLLNSWYCIHTHGGSSRIDSFTKIKSKTEVIISTNKYIMKNFSKKYRLLSSMVYLSNKIIQLIILYPFSKIKREILKSLLSYLIKKSPLIK